MGGKFGYNAVSLKSTENLNKKENAEAFLEVGQDLPLNEERYNRLRNILIITTAGILIVIAIVIVALYGKDLFNRRTTQYNETNSRTNEKSIYQLGEEFKKEVLNGTVTPIPIQRPVRFGANNSRKAFYAARNYKKLGLGGKKSKEREVSLRESSSKEGNFIQIGTGVALTAFMASSGYLYSKYAMPELTDPTPLDEVIRAKIGNIALALDSIKTKYSNFKDKFFTADSTKSLDEMEPKLAKSPVDVYFEKISQTVKEVKAEKLKPKGASTALQDFFMELEITSQLAKEKEEVETVENLEKVSVKQVGLSLESNDLLASIYQIKNLFKVPGSVAHLFIIQKRTETPLINAFRINFSSDAETFRNSFENGLKISATDNSLDSLGYEFIKMESYGTLSDEIKAAITPKQAGLVHVINPYKWLYFATRLDSELPVADLKPIVVLLYRKSTNNAENEPQIIYTEDVDLFDESRMEKADKALFTGSTKRILNHCKEYLPSETIKI